MIVTLSAVHGKAQPGRGSGFHSIKQDHPALFFGDGSPFAIEQMISVKAARNFLFVRRFRQ